MPEGMDDKRREASGGPVPPTGSQVLSNVYRKVLRTGRMHRAIAAHVENWNRSDDDESWRMMIL